jgi:hypothetical protein
MTRLGDLPICPKFKARSNAGLPGLLSERWPSARTKDVDRAADGL